MYGVGVVKPAALVGDDCTKGPQLIVRSSRVLILFFAAALVGLAMVSGVLVFQLSRGPISLGFLTPLIEQALSSEAEGSQLQLHDTVLTWEEEERALDIRATGLQFLDSAGQVQATIPEMTIKFSARALLRGLIAPTSLELFGPRLRVVRDTAGDINLDFGGSSATRQGGGAPVGLITELLRAPDPDLASGYLTRIAVRNAYVEFEDRLSGHQLLAPNTDVVLERDFDGIHGDGSILLGGGESAIQLGVSGNYRIRSQSGDIGFVFSDIDPATLVPFDAALEPLARLQARLDGTLTLALDEALRDISGSLDLEVSAGAVDATPVYEAPLLFEGAALRLNFEQATETVTLEAFDVVLGETTLSLSGAASRTGDSWVTALDATLRSLPVNDIALFWPPEIEPNAREWITENVRDGQVEEMTARARATVPESDPASFVLDDVGAEIRFEGTTVHYLRPMEPVTDGIGVARITASEVVIDVTQARLRDVVAENGRVVIGGLDGPSKGETITIEVTAAGPVRDTLEVLDTEPLGFVSGFGIDPTRTTGRQRTNAVFAFPLLDAITVDEIAVAISSRLTDFSAEEAAFGFPITNGNLDLVVNREGLEATGTADINDIPIGLTWVERFNKDGEVRTRYEVRTNLGEAARERLGFETAPYLTGPFGLGLTYSEGWDGVGAGAAELDLTESAVSLDPFGWTKAPGVAGRGFMRFHARNDGFVSVTEFDVSAADLELTGAARFQTSDGGVELRDMQFSKLVFGDNDLVAAVDMSQDGVPAITLAGASIDLRPLLVDLFSDDQDDAEGTTPALRIVVSEQAPLNSVRLGQETSLLGAHGWLINDGQDWADVLLRGQLSNAGNVYVRIEPEENLRRLLIETDDGGGLLSALDWVDTIRDGEMRVRGTFEGTGDTEVLSGQVDAQGFVLTEEPFAAKVLALASFSGIADVLGGQGITFRRAEIPFRMTNREIVIKDAKARGAEIGIIASGTVNRDADILDMEGEMAPAYTLNSLLANIPLIGQVLSGGSEGIFAATFSATGPLENPEVSVNSLSVLTPGIIRQLLSGFGNENEAGTQPQVPEPLEPEIAR
jgi:hypothetical protein